MTEHSGSHGAGDRGLGAELALRLGRAAALSLIAGTIGGAAVLAGEAFVARNRRYAQPELGLALRATVGRPGAAPLRLVLLGDSSALGVGVGRLGDTVGGQLAHLLAEGPAGRQVHLSSVGVSGSRSTDLATQVARALLGPRPDVAVILIGANDATALRRPAEAGAYLGAAVRRLREAHVEVVVGTCPDLGAVHAIAPPLRQVVGWAGRRVARAQTVAVLDAGGTVVDLGTETGPVFRADAGTFCHDGFHPSADGYRVWAHALIPAVAAAANVTSRH
ncbi:SGNH/GDSL hydrolase family protein [Micromonospora sp. CA-111912]|uniref:SGNH/GDSL hydrolase family protein n=1 Tax=Micromonospora sp. CA-111912 TaxID=3239955 RepID=UPI003D8FBC77